MHHLLLGLPVRQLGRAPFVAAVRDAMDVKARELDLTVCPGAYVHMAPNIGGFVGSDHVAALLATQEFWQYAATTLVMDIGTNTEISLIHGGEIVSASCPVRSGARGWPHLLRHAGGGRRHRARYGRGRPSARSRPIGNRPAGRSVRLRA